jgi:hypothetical protein
MSDLSERLRQIARDMDTMQLWPRQRDDLNAAADRIEQLETENERLLHAINLADERIERLEGRTP